MATNDSNPAVWVLSRERDTATEELDRLQSEMKSVRHKLRSLEEAIAILTGQPVAKFDGVTLKDLILEQVRAAADGMTPLAIANAITTSGRDTSNTSVSSILSRLKKDHVVHQKGDRWHASGKTNTASDVDASEAVEESGPVGRERGYPPSAPEGSNPSGSTTSSRLADLYSRPLDEDIPF